MVKKFYGMSQKLSGVNPGATGPGGNSQSKYEGSTIGFDVESGRFLEKQRQKDNLGYESKYVTPENLIGTDVDDSLINSASYKQFQKSKCVK